MVTASRVWNVVVACVVFSVSCQIALAGGRGGNSFKGGSARFQPNLGSQAKSLPGAGSYKSLPAGGFSKIPTDLGNKFPGGKLGKVQFPSGKLPGDLGKLPGGLGKTPLPGGKIPFPGGKLPGDLGKLPGDLGGKIPLPGGKIPFPGGKLPGDDGKIPLPGGKIPFPGGGNNPPPGGGNNPPGGGNNPPGGGNNPPGKGDCHDHCHDHWCNNWWGPFWGFGFNCYNGGYCYDGCYGPAFGGVVSQPIIVEQPVVVSSPVVVESALVKAAVSAIDLVVGKSYTLRNDAFGAQAGQMMLEVGEVGLPLRVDQWQAQDVSFTVPFMGLSKPASAVLHIASSEQKLVKSIPVRLIPASNAVAEK